MRAMQMGFAALMCGCPPGAKAPDTGWNQNHDMPEGASQNWTGTATVVIGSSFVGEETNSVYDADGTLICQLTYPLTTRWVEAPSDCPDCTFAFSLDDGEATIDVDDGCAALGINQTNPTEISGMAWDMTSGEVWLYNGHYTWSVFEYATGAWDGDPPAEGVTGTFAWDWHSQERWYYWYE